MLVSGIKSKPVYEPLCADAHGRYHLMLAVGGAATALLRVLDELAATDPDAVARSRVLFVPEAGSGLGSGSGAGPFTGPDPLSGVDPFADRPELEVRRLADIPTLLAAFRILLDESRMGTRLYVAGPESFIGRAVQLALEFNMNQDEIRAEALGSLARRVHCVHCRTVMENVRTNIVECTGCARWLLVRDHYSRRLAAYMGVMVDAEAPGQRPEIRVIYP